MNLADLLVLAGSVLVVALMVGMAALLGFKARARIVNRAMLERLIGESEPDARVEQAWIDAQGRGAVARLADGHVAAARVMGAEISVRLVSAEAVTLHQTEDGVMARFADLGFPAVKLKLTP